MKRGGRFALLICAATVFAWTNALAGESSALIVEIEAAVLYFG